MMQHRETRPAAVRAVGSLLAALLWLSCIAGGAFAETQIVIDPTEVPEAQKSSPAAAKKPAQPDAAVVRNRQRAEDEQRRRAKAEARALAAEKESAKLRAMEQARQAEAASRASAMKLASQKAAAARAESARLATAKIIKEDFARHEAARKLTADKESAARVAAAKEAAAKELAAMEQAAKELAARESAARELAARELAAKELAAKESASKEQAAKELAAREKAAKDAAARDAALRVAAVRESSAKEISAKRVQPRFGTAFRDCANCPELVWLPEGEFIMGEPGANTPQRRVRINYMLAVGRFEVTFAEWDACVAAGGCRRRPADAGWGRGWQPVINVSWSDASQYAAWLSRLTGKNYRLLSDAEWEYAARAGSDVRFWWGNNAGQGNANCSDCGSKWDGHRAAPVGRFVSNPFGLHDMHGNVAEWVADCNIDRSRNTQRNGESRNSNCSVSDARMQRGGTWDGPAHTVRSAARSTASQNDFDNRTGFRIARTE